jgi:hypothetical protein
MTDEGEAAGPLTVVGRLSSALAAYGVQQLMVTGSAALGVWSTPRQSRDIDLCGSVPASAVYRILARFDGLAAGPPDAPGLLRLRFLDWDVDLFVTSDDPYYQECFVRAVEVTTDAGAVRVVTAEDLLIHKLIKLRTDRRRLLQDLADMRAVMQAQQETIDWAYLRRWLPSPEAEFLSSLSTASDEDLARRIFGA